MNLSNYFESYISLFPFIDENKVEEVIKYLWDFDKERKIYLIGNGGSFALAEHFAQDLLKRAILPAFSLSNMCNLTAFSNDIDFSLGFKQQLGLFLNPEDCLICFSSSGNSDNIWLACKTARFFEAKIISFTGFNGGRVKELSDYNIHIPSNDYGIVESMHSLIFHYIAEKLSRRFP